MNTMNGWHKNLPPQHSMVCTGQSAKDAYAVSLALDDERARQYVQGPTERKYFKQLPTPLKVKS